MSKYSPMLVRRFLVNTDLESKELTAALSFGWGVAEPSHYYVLLDLTNLLLVGGHKDKKSQYAVDAANNTFLPVLTSIKSRYERTGKLGVSATEKDILVKIVEVSKDYWNRRSTKVYLQSCRELQAYYDESRAK